MGCRRQTVSISQTIADVFRSVSRTLLFKPAKTLVSSIRDKKGDICFEGALTIKKLVPSLCIVVDVPIRPLKTLSLQALCSQWTLLKLTIRVLDFYINVLKHIQERTYAYTVLGGGGGSRMERGVGSLYKYLML